MNKKTVIIIIAASVIFIVIAAFLNNPKQAPAETETTPVAEPVTTPITSGVYTLAQVAMHADATSCWSAVNGNVYDLTAWIGQHPGGKAAIAGICGKDGSVAFNGQHEGGKKQADILATFKIGALAQ